MLSRRTLIASIIAGTLAAPALAAEPLKVGFVYVGPVGDAGWTHAHDLGRKEMEKALPGQIKSTYVESVPEGADAERVIRQLAAAGNKLIFTTSFGYMNQTQKVAQAFPQVKFAHATGYKTAKNVAIYNPKTYEGSYLMGVIAGGMTKSDTLGFVGSFPIPEVIRNINAYTLGAQSVNPKIKTKVVWVNSWYDPAKERQAAETLIAQGADVLAQNTDSPAIVQTAQEKGKYAFGWDTDMKKFGPKSQLAASVINWGGYYTRTAKAVLANNWKSDSVDWGVKDGMVDVVSVNPAVPKPLLAKFDAKKAQFAAGKFHSFTGPIVDQAGKTMVAAGQVLPQKGVDTMNWYVKGIEGSIPK